MAGRETYTYLTELLRDKMVKAYPKFTDMRHKGYGAFDEQPKAGKIAHLSLLLEENIYRGEQPLMYADGEGNVYAYNGKVYEGVGNGYVFLRELVKRTLMALKVGGVYVALASGRIARTVMDGLESSDEYRYRPEQRYIAFTNGIFDVEKGELKEFNRKYVPAVVLDIPYIDAKAHYVECEKKYGYSGNPCRLWENFIGKSAGEGVFPNVQIREAFQSFCGLMLVNRDEVKVEYMACVYGPGSNGKSVLADAVKSVFGDRYYSNFTPKQLFKEGSASDFRMNELDGKLINIVGDLDKSDFSGGDFKRFISGEKIKARGVYGSVFRTIKPPIMLCCANEIPDTTDDSYGHYRRLLPLPSTTKIWTERDKDPFLTAKLTTEDARIYIFSWIYEGYKRVMKSGGRIPLGEDVIKAQTILRSQCNSMRRWWAECQWCVPETNEGGAWRKLSDLYAEYKQWCEMQDEVKFRVTDLGRMFTSLGMTKENRYKRSMPSGTEYRLQRKPIIDD